MKPPVVESADPRSGSCTQSMSLMYLNDPKPNRALSSEDTILCIEDTLSRILPNRFTVAL